MERRTFLTLTAHSVGLVFAAVIGIPAFLNALSPSPRRHAGPAWRRLGTAEEFPLGKMKMAPLELPPFDWARALKVKAVYVLRDSADSVVVFSRNCTDLSCSIVWDAGSECFFCPCHGGIFSKSGERMAGPPKRPLYRYATRVTDGVLEIDLNSLPPIT
jgi:menaquinol-cytochrome c reductase iron-sulfur subunit